MPDGHGRPHRRAESPVQAVRLGGSRQVGTRLGQREVTFWRPQKVKRVPGRYRDLQGRGIGQALLRFALTLARRMADEIGSIAVGYAADIIAVEGDPTTGIEALGAVRFVPMVRGK